MFGSILSWAAISLPAHAGVEEPSLVLTTRPIDKAEWLIRQPDKAFTIQLLTVSSRAQLKEFVAGEPALPRIGWRRSATKAETIFFTS